MVWGEFAVGMEQLSLSDPADLPIPTLRLPNGKEVAGHVVPDQKPGPHARWAFTVNTDDLAPGVQSTGCFRQGRRGPGSPKQFTIFVDAIKPAADAIQSGNCQDSLNTDRTANDGRDLPEA